MRQTCRECIGAILCPHQPVTDFLTDTWSAWAQAWDSIRFWEQRSEEARRLTGQYRAVMEHRADMYHDDAVGICRRLGLCSNTGVGMLQVWEELSAWRNADSAQPVSEAVVEAQHG